MSIMASIKEILQKFDSACRILAGSDKSRRDRLEKALLEISSLQDRDFNPDYRKGFQKLSEKIRIYRDAGDRWDMESDLALAILET